MSQPMTLQLRINADGTAAVTALKGVQQGLDKTGAAARTAGTETNRLVTSLRGLAVTAAGSLAVGTALAALARGFVVANIESDKLAKGLRAVTGSSTAASLEMDYVRGVASRMGISVADAGNAYLSLAAAAKGTVLEGKASKDVFEAVSLAMGKLGKSSADAAGALLAIQQSISKDKISAEELTQQLGERLPGATKAFADSLGKTTAELMAMMANGELTTAMWEQFAAQLNKIYNDGQKIDGLTSAWGRFKNQIDALLVALDDQTGLTHYLDLALNKMAAVAGASANWAKGEGFTQFASQQDRFNALLTENIRLEQEFFAKAQEVANLEARPGGWLDVLKTNLPTARDELRQLGEEWGGVRAKLAGVQEGMKQLEQSATRAKDAAATAPTATADALVKSRADIDQMLGKYDKTIAKQAEYARMQSLVAEAVKLGALTQEQATAKLAAFAAAQDKAAAAASRHGQALSAEAQVVADIEKKYGLMAGQLDAVWKLESGRGKTAGTNSERWVKDLAAGEGHMTKLVGQFQMAEGTAKGLGANMGTFNGQADAAAKYLAQAAAQGKTLWEQFAYYHGSPNEKAWGEKTRAYADEAVKIVAEAGGAMQDLGQNTGQAITDMLNRANAAVQNLIQRYLPAKAAAQDYAQAQLDIKNSTDFANLSQEEQAIILQGLQKDFEKSRQQASETASAWAEVWKNAVKRIDDTFANLWSDLFSGAKSSLESIKRAISSWLAEVAHALLTKPLVVAITASMTGGSGAAGAVGTAGTVANSASGMGSLGNLASGLSSLFNWGGSALSSIFSGAVFAGISNGFGMAMANIGASSYFGAFGANMALAGSSFSTGAIGTAIGAAAPYLLAALPIAAIAVGVLSKYFSDQKPRTGAYAATTNGGTGQLEDNIGVRGAFGLTFGVNDKGSANMDANELRQTFEGFAKVSETLAQFYGAEVSAQIEATLEKISREHYAKTGILNYAMDVNQAFDVAFTQIIDAAAATGDSVAVVMKAVVGDLNGTAEQMAGQIEAAMNTTSAVISVAKALEGTDTGKILELGDSLTANALRLVDYANAIKWQGETTAAALGRMGQYMTALSTALELSGNTVDATGQAFIDLARNLAYAADVAKIGVEGLLQLQAFFFDQFTSAQDKAARAMEAASKVIADSFKELKADGITDNLDVGDRAGFVDLVNGLDLTTESGRKLYVELMKLAPAFDVLFDSMEAFRNWLDPVDTVDEALTSLTAVFSGWGLRIPPTRDALEELVAAGGLTTEQMAILGGYTTELGIIFGDVGNAAQDVTDKFRAQRQELMDLANVLDPRTEMQRRGDANKALRDAGYTGNLLDPIAIAEFLRAMAALGDAGGDAGKKLMEFSDVFREVFEEIARIAQEKDDLFMRALGAIGDEEVLREAERMRERQAIDKSNLPLLEFIYGIEDAQRARDQALEAERQALDSAHQARMAALEQERAGANALLSLANGLLSSIQSALSALRGAMPSDEISIARGRRQMSGWATSRRLPDQKSLDRAITGIGADEANRYATAAAYRLSRQTDLANLLVLEKLAAGQVSDAERLWAGLDTLQNTLTAQHEASLAALDQKYTMDADWKKQQLALLAELMLKLEAPNDGSGITAPTKPLLALDTKEAPNPGLAAQHQTQEIVALRQEIAMLHKDIVILSAAQASPLRAMDDRLKKWDLDGLPSGRDDVDVTLLRAA